jgi:excisionase family DNA binding protein
MGAMSHQEAPAGVGCAPGPAARPELLTVSECARELRCSRATVYRKIGTGELEARRLGEVGQLRIPADAIGRLLTPVRPAA